MQNLVRTATSLICLLASLYGQAAIAMETQVSAGLVTSGTADISSASSSTFGYTVDGYSGAQLGLALVFDNHQYLLLNTRNLKGKTNFAGDMTRTDNLIAWSPGYTNGGTIYVGWKTGESHVVAAGKNMYNFSSSGPFLGVAGILNFSPNLIGSLNLSIQYIMNGRYRPSTQAYSDISSDARGYGGGAGLTYLINERLTVAAEYKYSWNSYKFKTECFSCNVGGLVYSHYTGSYDLDEFIRNAELTLKYKF